MHVWYTISTLTGSSEFVMWDAKRAINPCVYSVPQDIRVEEDAEHVRRCGVRFLSYRFTRQ